MLRFRCYLFVPGRHSAEAALGNDVRPFLLLKEDLPLEFSCHVRAAANGLHGLYVAGRRVCWQHSNARGLLHIPRA